MIGVAVVLSVLTYGLVLGAIWTVEDVALAPRLLLTALATGLGAMVAFEEHRE